MLAFNPLNRTADALTQSIAGLDYVDVDNSIAPTSARINGSHLRVAELNAERGRYWCDFAIQIRRTPTLAAFEVWLLNEFDLGMARSDQAHTVRLLAYALGRLGVALLAEPVGDARARDAARERALG